MLYAPSTTEYQEILMKTLYRVSCHDGQILVDSDMNFSIGVFNPLIDGTEFFEFSFKFDPMSWDELSDLVDTLNKIESYMHDLENKKSLRETALAKLTIEERIALDLGVDYD